MEQKPPQFDFTDYPGLSDPKWTQIPDEVLDFMLPGLTGAELKVFLYVMRRTYGFKREADQITLVQLSRGIRKRDGTYLDYGTGLSRRAVIEAIKTLEAKGLVEVLRRTLDDGTTDINTYRVRQAQSGRVQKSNPPSADFSPRGVQKSNPQETVIQETDENEQPPVGGSVSFFQQIGERYGKGKRDQKALSTALSKYSEESVRWAVEALENGFTHVQNPAAWLNAVVPRLIEELSERKREQLTQRQEQLAMIRATAHFYGQVDSPARVGERLLEDFGDAELVGEALGAATGPSALSST
jgi:hypothetical protein